MNILIAPDKFKGSLTADQVCAVFQKVLLENFQQNEIVTLPLADGGEGSASLLATFSGGTWQEVAVHDPLHRKIIARYGLSSDRSVAYMEMASASGLQLLSKEERNPMLTSTYGTGEMIRHALDLGVKEIVLGIGGSATNDGGIGMAQALGLTVFDKARNLLRVNGENLSSIHSLEITQVHSRLKEIVITVFCDVDNSLHGPTGAAYIFAPQKGATPSDVALLDKGLRHLESIVRKTFQISLDFPGAGAAGGIAVGLKILSRLNIVSGMKFISEFVDLEEKIRAADIIITGEGQLDEQTLSGKVVKGVTDLASRYQKPVIAVVGKCTLSQQQIRALGIQVVITLVDEETEERDAIRSADIILEKRIREKVLNLIKKAEKTM